MNDVPIIERPDRHTPGQRLMFGALATAFWMLWLYLWLPMVSFIAWLLGIDVFYREMVEQEGYLGVLQLLAFYGTVVVVIGGSLVAWALYNWWRFRGVERRRIHPPVPLRDVARRFGLTPETLVHCRQARRMVIHHDANGHVVAVDGVGFEPHVSTPEQAI